MQELVDGGSEALFRVHSLRFPNYVKIGKQTRAAVDVGYNMIKLVWSNCKRMIMLTNWIW